MMTANIYLKSVYTENFKQWGVKNITCPKNVTDESHKQADL